jgi:predicted O-methyltransferase YrrM
VARSRIVTVAVTAAVGTAALAVGAVAALVDLGVAVLPAVALGVGLALLAVAAVLALLHVRTKVHHLEDRIERGRSDQAASLTHLRGRLDELAGNLDRTSSQLAEAAGQLARLNAGSERTDTRIAELGRTVDRTGRTLSRDVEVARRRSEGTVRVVTALGLPTPLPPLDGWAVLGDLAAELVRLVRFDRPRLVVELGGGVSTLLIAAALERNGEGRLVSLDHDVEYLERTRTELRANGLEHRVDLVHAPLEDREFDGDTYRWYRVSTLDEVRDVDLVLVDGPPGTTGPLARFPAGPVLIPRLTVGGSILLDDANRPEEHEIARRWAGGSEGLDLEVLPELGKGLAILRRR